MENTFKINITEQINNERYETRKYHLIARHLESLVVEADIESIKKLESNEKIKPYIRYIGGIGGSRALEFCVAKKSIEKNAIETIEYILSILKKEKRKIQSQCVNGMLNVAIIYEKEEIIDFLLSNEQLKKKINFAHQNYMIIKNMTLPNVNKYMFKKMIIDKIIPLDSKVRQLIEKSQNEDIINIVSKIDLKEKIEKNLTVKPEIKTKRNKI